MKFGVLMHKNALNFGDDVQSYAISRFLPEIDYFVDREHLNTFKSDNDEPVAVVMCAWYMWHKWNWPPADNIVPLLTSIHYSDHQIGKQPGSPVKYEFLQGIGGEYMNSYGPVGCRDIFTMEKFREIGIDSYFSGCITLTIPKMPAVKADKEYICAVDLFPEGEAYLRKLIEGSNIELKVFTHNKDKRNPDKSWEETEEKTAQRLTIYQNAKCVITRRLHCALPCLGMEVPVFVINDETPEGLNRFGPYIDWFEHCTPEQFVKGEFSYNFITPPKNKGLHLETREKLIKTVTEFVEKYKNLEGSKEDFIKTTYTKEQLSQWRIETMNSAMDLWYTEHRKTTLALWKEQKNNLTLKNENKKYKAENGDNKKQIEKLKSSTESKNNEINKLKKELDKQKNNYCQQIKMLEKENKRQYRIIHCRPVRLVIRFRNLFYSKNKKIKL